MKTFAALLLLASAAVADNVSSLYNGTRNIAKYPISKSQDHKSNMVWIGSRRFSAGFDLNRGGALAYFADYTTNTGNVIDSFDAGRLVQQSYYGDSDGSNWNGQPWVFNPVQGGNWRDEPGRLDGHAVANDKTWFKTTSTPRNWAGLQMLENVKMYSWAQFPNQDVMKIAFSMKYTGGAFRSQPRHQEIPAVFLNRRFGNLVIGDMFSGNMREFLDIPSTNWYLSRDGRLNYRKFWFAYVEGRGSNALSVGYYVSEATDLTAYRVGNPGQAGSCSYAAPLMTSTMPEFYAYNVYMTIGRLADVQRRLMAMPK